MLLVKLYYIKFFLILFFFFKCDQPKEGTAANSSKLDEYCKEKGFVGWFETSAKDNINIDDAAKYLVGTVSSLIIIQGSAKSYV